MASKAAVAAVVSLQLCFSSSCQLNPANRILPECIQHWDWGKVSTLIRDALRTLTVTATETIAALQAFRKRHGDAQRIHAQYTSQPTTVDFAHYRSVLRNTAIVDEAEKLLKDFKPVTYDVNAHIKAIETFEAKAVSRRNSANCSVTSRLIYLRSRKPKRPHKKSMSS